MKRIFFSALFLAASCLFSSTGHAAVTLSGSLTNGLNTWQDQSLDVLIDQSGTYDVDGNLIIGAADGVFGAGDILYGFARLDSQIAPPPGQPIAGNSSYVVFSQTIYSQISGAVTFQPTTGAFSVATLTGDGTISASAYMALYEKAAGFGDLITNGLAPATNIGTITTGSLILTAGVGNATDFFNAAVIDSNSITLANVIASSTTIANFSAGLSILSQPGLPGITFNPTVSVAPPFLLAPASLHQLGISAGTVSGRDHAPLDHTTDPYSYANQLQASVNVSGVVPEPGSMLVWAGMSLAGACAAYRRRRKVAG